MRSEMFQHEMTATSEVFGRKKDVKVVFKGTQAQTNGKEIVYPALPPGKEVSEETMLIMRGYNDHETAHIRYTDMEGAKPWRKEWKTGDNIEEGLMQGLEDVRIERKRIKEFPGSLKNLRATTTSVNGELLKAIEEGRVEPEQLADPKAIVDVALTWEGRKHYGEETCGQLLDLLSEPVREKLTEWIDRLDDCKNTVDVCELSAEIAEELRGGAGEYQDVPEGEPEAGDGDGDGDAERSDTSRDEGDAERSDVSRSESEEGEGESKGEESKGEGEEGEGDVSPDDASEGEASEGDASEGETSGGDGRDAERSDGKGEPAATPPKKPVKKVEMPDMGKALERELKDEGLSHEGVDPSQTYTSVVSHHDWYPHAKMKTRPEECVSDARFRRWMGVLRDGTAADYNRKAAAMTGAVNVMRRGLERALMAKVERDWHRNLESGLLDTRRFAAAMAGRRTIRKQRDDSVDIDTAVQIVVDLSGSMGSDGCRKAKVAQDCVIAICEAIGRTGVALEVIGFTNDWDSKAGSKTMGRVEPLEMPLFKAFDDRLVDAKGPLSTIVQAVDANNSDSEALMLAYARLARRPEKRKIMMVLSDGEPAFAYNVGKASSMSAMGMYQQHLRDAVDYIEGEGVDCVGIGILTTAVRRYYPKAVVVSNVNDLAKVAMGELAGLLLGRASAAKTSIDLLPASGSKKLMRKRGKAA